MAKIFTFNSTNVINYTICILLVSQNYYFCISKYMTEPSTEMMKQLIKCIARYMSNDCNSATLGMKGCNKGQYFPGPKLEDRCPEIFDYYDLVQ